MEYSENENIKTSPANYPITPVDNFTPLYPVHNHSNRINRRMQSRGNWTSKPFIDAKLKISSPDDPSEKEADKIAEQITGDRPSGLLSNGADHSKVHAKSKAEAQSSSSSSSIIQNIQGGQPLDKSEKNYFEPRLQADLSSVKIHTDAKDGRVADSIGARAFTVGHDIVFAKGEYQPGSGEGKKLLAHELVHVIQQNPGLHEIHRFAEPGRIDPANEIDYTSGEKQIALQPDKSISKEDEAEHLLFQKIEFQIAIIKVLMTNPALPAADKKKLETDIAQLAAALINYIKLKSQGGTRENSLAGLGAAALVITGDDVTGIGVADDWVLVILGLAAIGVLLFTSSKPGQGVLDDALLDIGRKCDALSKTLVDVIPVPIPLDKTIPRERTRDKKKGPFPIYWPYLAGKGLQITAPNPANSISIYKPLVRSAPVERDLTIIPTNIATGMCWHHVTPLFLGGPDSPDNLAQNYISYHIAGHTALRIQPHLTYLGISSDLYQHPIGTPYVVAIVA